MKIWGVSIHETSDTRCRRAPEPSVPWRAACWRLKWNTPYTPYTVPGRARVLLNSLDEALLTAPDDMLFRSKFRSARATRPAADRHWPFQPCRPTSCCPPGASIGCQSSWDAQGPFPIRPHMIPGSAVIGRGASVSALPGPQPIMPGGRTTGCSGL